MIRLDVEQGYAEWVAARLGIPTASCFDKIITPKTMKPSASADKYAWELIAERVLGRPVDDASSGFSLGSRRRVGRWAARSRRTSP